MKERPTLMSGPMVRACLRDVDPKWQTRRVMNPQPDLVYGLHDDRIQVIHNVNEDKIWRAVETNPSVSEFGLHGGRRWEDLFQDQIRRLWEEGVRGVVSVERPHHFQGVFNCFLVPQQREGHEVSSHAGLHGISRNSIKATDASASSRREQGQQQAGKSSVGESARAVAGHEDSRDRTCWGKALGGEALRLGKRTLAMGDTKGTVQSEIRGICPKNVPSLHLCDCQWWPGLKLWVRETWRPANLKSPRVRVEYRADMSSWGVADSHDLETNIVTPDAKVLPGRARPFSNDPWKPSIFMPRWACRLVLEITKVRVERVQDITAADAIAEGIVVDNSQLRETPNFRELWDSINAKRGFGWKVNPWVWVIEFKRV